MFAGWPGMTAVGGNGDGPLQPVIAVMAHREIINGPRIVTVVLPDNTACESFQALHLTRFANGRPGGGEL
jgi:hypothetical protein